MVKDRRGDFVVMGRNMLITVHSKDGKELESHKVSYGSRIALAEGKKVARGDKLAEWDPYAEPIITEVGGKVQLVDLVEGVSYEGRNRRRNRHHQ